MSRRVAIAITHAADEVGRHFASEDLAKLRAVADVRILGSGVRSAVLPQLGEIEILLGSWGMPRLDAELLAAAPRLRAVCYAAGSVKNFTTRESYERGVVVTSAAHANAVPVAEVTLALITLANKGWFHAQHRLRGGTAAVREPLARGNFATCVGLIGLGEIGRMVVEKLSGMDVEVLAYDPHQQAPDGVELVASLAELAARSDVVSVHAPALPATRHMCGAEFFAAMRDGATFINTARGSLVDEAALIAELETGRISAHLDVTDPEPPPPGSPLRRLPNVWLTPHLAGSTGNELQRMGRLAIRECLALIDGRTPRHAVAEEMLARMA